MKKMSLLTYLICKMDKRLFFSVFPILFLVSCAQQSALSGGEKDTTAPVLDVAKTFPASRTTNFNATEIQIGFNEFIRLNNPKKNVVITPSLSFDPVYEVKGKKIIITLKDELAKNTTYLINFGNSISDITERNKIPNFNYVLSTGAEIDSLELAGSVYDAFSKTSEKEILVALYKTNKDSLALIEKPYYFTQTNKQGDFKFKNLKEGAYTLLAIDDKNGNYKFDPKSERIAFLDSFVSISSDSINQHQFVNLSLFEEEKEKIFISSKKYIHPGKVELVLNTKSKITTVTMLDNSFVDGGKVKEFKQKDTITFWVKKIDSISRINFIANIENFDADTTKVNVKKLKKNTDSILRYNTNTRDNVPFFENVIFTFKTPIAKVNNDYLKLIDEDSVAVPFQIKTERNKVFIVAQLKEDVDYELFAYPNAFIDAYSRTIDSTHLFFKVKPENKFGNLILHYQKETELPHILHLIKNGTVLEEIYIVEKTKTLTFSNLSVGNYTLKTIFDANNNKNWDTGNYLNILQPEKVKLFEDKIEIKAGWDVDLTWKN